jgi:hypothetical protein
MKNFNTIKYHITGVKAVLLHKIRMAFKELKLPYQFFLVFLLQKLTKKILCCYIIQRTNISVK